MRGVEPEINDCGSWRGELGTAASGRSSAFASESDELIGLRAVTTCSRCGSEVPDNLAKCPCCGADAGYPNVKLAGQEAAALTGRADTARADAKARGASGSLAEFEHALTASHAVVNVDIEFLFRLLSSDKTLYTAYGKLIAADVRVPAAPDDDRQRTAVDAILFGSWGKEIVFAAIALDGRGPGTYGSISLELKELAIELRASVLEENSYAFVRRHGLGPFDSIPAGYRAPWATRSEVAIAKLAPRVVPTTTKADHPLLLLNSDGVDRSKDEFIEVHVYGPFNRQAIQRITVLSKPKDPGERHRLNSMKKTAKSLGIQWSAA